ncbi:MAG: YqaA family protein [Bradymonadaceae bacterium]
MTETADRETEPDVEEPTLAGIARDALLFTILVVGLIFLAGLLLRAPLRNAADWLVAEMGMTGMFVGIFVADAFTVPIPPDTYLFLGIAADTDLVATLAVCSLASVAGGNVAYWIGPYIERIPLLESRLENFRPRGEALFSKWGGWAVSVAAMTPVPFSVVSWLAGIYRMPYSRFLAASLVRIPRIVGYYALYSLGWAPGLN